MKKSVNFASKEPHLIWNKATKYEKHCAGQKVLDFQINRSLSVTMQR